MKKFITLGVIMIIASIMTFGSAGTALAETWKVLISNHKFVVNGEAVTANALNINGNNYVKVAEFAELLDIDVSFDENTGTVFFDKSKSFSEVKIDNKYNNIITEENSFPVSIPSIEAGKVVCIGSITISSDYNLIYDVSAEQGVGLFVALSEDGERTSFSGKQWHMFTGSSNKVQSRLSIPSNLANGSYYLYVGSTDEPLINIQGTVTQSLK